MQQRLSFQQTILENLYSHMQTKQGKNNNNNNNKNLHKDIDFNTSC